MTHHALQRIAERLTPAERERLTAELAAYAAAHPVGSYAVRALTLAAQRNAAWGNASNGDWVVAIIRDGALVTCELRRSTQPWNRAALRVDRLDIL